MSTQPTAARVNVEVIKNEIAKHADPDIRNRLWAYYGSELLAEIEYLRSEFARLDIHDSGQWKHDETWDDLDNYYVIIARSK